jgi:glycosyltransferase involved in cell wall biosynthesis
MKILIWHTCKLGEGGGPAGYLGNYRTYLQTVGCREISFLGDMPELASSDGRDIEAVIPRFARRALRKSGSIARKAVRALGLRSPGIEALRDSIRRAERPYALEDRRLDEFDVIHFHSTWEVFNARRVLDDYRGKVVVMSHSPKPWHRELIEDFLGLRMESISKALAARVEKIDAFGFGRADAVMFPCEDSMESYSRRWPRFDGLVRGKRLMFVPTAFEPLSAGIPGPGGLERAALGLPAEGVVAFFAGRHTEVKGYDFLLERGPELLDRWPNLRIVCAGAENSRYKIAHPRWIELGWRKDVAQLMGAVDFYLLPNRETYFDLVLLEAMACRLPVVLSETGGNKYFKDYRSRGLRFFDIGSKSSFVDAVDSLMRLSSEGRKDAGAENAGIIRDSFTFKAFHENYLAQMADLASRKN